MRYGNFRAKEPYLAEMLYQRLLVVDAMGMEGLSFGLGHMEMKSQPILRSHPLGSYQEFI